MINFTLDKISVNRWYSGCKETGYMRISDDGLYKEKVFFEAQKPCYVYSDIDNMAYYVNEYGVFESHKVEFLIPLIPNKVMHFIIKEKDGQDLVKKQMSIFELNDEGHCEGEKFLYTISCHKLKRPVSTDLKIIDNTFYHSDETGYNKIYNFLFTKKVVNSVYSDVFEHCIKVSEEMNRRVRITEDAIAFESDGGTRLVTPIGVKDTNLSIEAFENCKNTYEMLLIACKK